MDTMDKTTIKVWKTTRKKLKMMAAEYGVPMTQLLEMLVVQEKERKNGHKD